MSTSNKICNDKSKSNDNDVCEVNSMLQNMSTDDNNKNSGISNTCANCGKEGGDVTNTCNKCKMVMYCNAACKKKHKNKHKKQCERIVAALHEEALFKQPPTLEDCPICFQLLPSLETGSIYKSCCGKTICSGCWYANVHIDIKKQLCAFCRTQAPKTEKESRRRIIKRIEAGDAVAIYNLGCDYTNGTDGYPIDYIKALELFQRAGELVGHAGAYANIGNAYFGGRGVEVDKKKAINKWELAAMGGDVQARHNLGCEEEVQGNMNRAIKHWIIAVRSGNTCSLDAIKDLCTVGQATKEDYSKALQAYQAYLKEIKSAQRDRAAADDYNFRYY